jgi:ABC-2 type transport system ATP-binding protein
MSDAIVRTQGLGKSIGRKTILRDISVQAMPGDIVGMIGKNGAGKTTLLDVLLGFSPATCGTAAVLGSESLRLSAAAKARIGFVPQQDELIESITGAEHIAVHAALHRRWNGALIDRLAGDWGVPLARPVQSFSGGERQKLSTLLALGHEPDLLVLDEPASSLDPIARRQFLQQLLEIAEAPARTVILSSHIVTDLERVANQVWMLKDGAVAWQGGLDLMQESVVRLRIDARRELPVDLGFDAVIRERRDGAHAELVVGRWDTSLHRRSAARLDAVIDVETLNLEDIFVELNS